MPLAATVPALSAGALARLVILEGTHGALCSKTTLRILWYPHVFPTEAYRLTRMASLVSCVHLEGFH